MKNVSRAKFGHEGVMGYHRPVSEFNKGKKEEFYERKCFTEEKAVARMNSQETLDNALAAE
jgi:hypothetical protein